MTKGSKIGMAVAVIGLTMMSAAFIMNSSPYVTIDEAMSSKGDNLHVAGKPVSGTIHNVAASSTVSFQITDKSGKVLNVDYHGLQPNNLAEATQVVAIGKMENGRLNARDLLMKCPTKYQDQKTQS